MTKMRNVREVKTAVIALINTAIDFSSFLDSITALNASLNRFYIFLYNNYDKDYNKEKWYIWIQNIYTKKEITIDVTDKIEKLD